MANNEIADDETHASAKAAARLPPSTEEPRFLVPLPRGRAARVPLEVLEQYVDAKAKSAHASPSRSDQAGPSDGPEHSTTIQAGESMVTINIYTGRGDVEVRRHDEDDVVAHSLAVDGATGMSEWHTDWEYGECEYTDESGFPQRIQAWHRHPFGTEYTELYEG